MSHEQDWDAVAEATRNALRDDLRGPLLAYLTKRDHLYDGERLRVGTDMKPDDESCERAIYYRLRKTPQDPPRLAQRIRYERGNFCQRLFATALREDGREVEEEVAAKALRPSAWAWSDGHGDVLDVRSRHLHEVKAPGLDAWRRAGGSPLKLVRESYRWQLSHYYHELKRMGRIDSASWIFFDMEGEHEPVEVPLTPDLVVPLSAIVAMESQRAMLLWATEPPARPQNAVVVTKVLKGGRKTKKNPTPARVVHAVSRRFWGCSGCPFFGTCQPGPEESPVTLADADPLRVAAVVEAEREWAAEDAEKARAKSQANGHDQDNEEAPSSSPPLSPPFPPTGGDPPKAEPPRAPLSDSSPPNGETFTPPSKADRAEAAAGLDEAMKEIDDRASRGESVFPVRVEGDEWGDQAPPGVGW